MQTVIATREGFDPHGNKYEEKIIRTGKEAFRLECRSDDPEDCFDANLNLQEIFEYTGHTAVKPFMRTVIDGGRC